MTDQPPLPSDSIEPEFVRVDGRIRSRRRRRIERLLLIDVLQDHDSRPALTWALSTLLIGTLIYHYLEGWSYLDALYFCVITLATVGYGDLTPTTPLAKLVTIIYIFNGVAILLALFDRIRVLRSDSGDGPAG
jgi:voltage-gated potassium channel